MKLYNTWDLTSSFHNTTCELAQHRGLESQTLCDLLHFSSQGQHVHRMMPNELIIMYLYNIRSEKTDETQMLQMWQQYSTIICGNIYFYIQKKIKKKCMQAVIKPKDNYAEDRLEQNRDIWIPIRSCNSLRDFSEPRWSEMNLSPPPHHGLRCGGHTCSSLNMNNSTHPCPAWTLAVRTCGWRRETVGGRGGKHTYTHGWPRSCWTTRGCRRCSWGGKASPWCFGWCCRVGRRTWTRCAPAPWNAWTVPLWRDGKPTDKNSVRSSFIHSVRVIVTHGKKRGWLLFERTTVMQFIYFFKPVRQCVTLQIERGGGGEREGNWPSSLWNTPLIFGQW